MDERLMTGIHYFTAFAVIAEEHPQSLKREGVTIA